MVESRKIERFHCTDLLYEILVLNLWKKCHHAGSTCSCCSIKASKAAGCRQRSFLFEVFVANPRSALLRSIFCKMPLLKIWQTRQEKRLPTMAGWFAISQLFIIDPWCMTHVSESYYTVMQTMDQVAQRMVRHLKASASMAWSLATLGSWQVVWNAAISATSLAVCIREAISW